MPRAIWKGRCMLFVAVVLGAVACGRTELSVGSLDAPDGPDASANDVSQAGCASGWKQLADVTFTPTSGYYASFQITALTPAAGRLFIGVQLVDEGGFLYVGTGFIASVPTAGGTLSYVTGSPDDPANLKHYAGGDLVQDGTSLYYARPTLYGSTVHYPDLVARPIAGGLETVIPNPLPGAPTMTVTAIAALDPGAVWVVTTPNVPTAWLLRWDGASTTVLGSFADSGSRVVVVGRTVFVGGGLHLWKASLDGGGVSDAGATWAEQGAQLLAGNDRSVFYTPEGRSIHRRDVDTGIDTRIAPSTSPGQWAYAPGTPAYADSTALYVAGLRVPVDGSPWTVFVDADLQALAGDACNIYLAEPNTGREDVGVYVQPK